MANRKELLLSLVLIGTALSACDELVPVETTEPTSCGIEAYGLSVGEIYKKGQIDLSYDKLRVIRPGMAVTLDYRPDRMNIQLDASERISRFYCG